MCWLSLKKTINRPIAVSVPISLESVETTIFCFFCFFFQKDRPHCLYRVPCKFMQGRGNIQSYFCNCITIGRYASNGNIWLASPYGEDKKQTKKWFVSSLCISFSKDVVLKSPQSSLLLRYSSSNQANLVKNIAYNFVKNTAAVCQLHCCLQHNLAGFDAC